MDYSNFVASFGKIDRMNNGSYSSSKLLWQVATECVSSLGLLDFIIYTFDQKNGELAQEAGYGFKNVVENKLEDPLKVYLGEGIVGDTAQKRTFQLVKDTSSDGRYILDGQRNESELSVPILWDGKLLGVLDSEHPTKYYFGEFHINAFYTIASFLGPRLALAKKEAKSFSGDNKYYLQFIELMEKDFLYRNEDLSLETVASHFGIHKSYLSKIINQASQKRFTEIVNQYRISDVKGAFQCNKHKLYTIMSIAYEAGFTSKASFNKIFKKETGLTPSQYIHQMV